MRFEEAKRALEAASNGRNTIITDDIGMPSVMVKIPAFRWCDVIDGGPDKLCSAFIVDGQEVDCIYISKYLNFIEYDRAYSLPGYDPANMVDIDDMRRACAKKGRGWHLMTNAEWCAIAHWCQKNGKFPRGNTEFGHDYHTKENEGIMSPKPLDGIVLEARTLTGSGHVNWSHDGTPYGIFDLNGNVWDAVAGLRTVDGEIQIIPDNNSALSPDESPNSPLWRAIMPDGTLVDPGTAGTYKFDNTVSGEGITSAKMIKGAARINTKIENPHYNGEEKDVDYAYTFMPFQDLRAADGVEIHPILVQLGLYPVSETLQNETLFTRTTGERPAFRGGSWYDGKFSGLWDLYMRDERAFRFPDIGFRSAYVEI